MHFFLFSMNGLSTIYDQLQTSKNLFALIRFLSVYNYRKDSTTNYAFITCEKHKICIILKQRKILLRQPLVGNDLFYVLNLHMTRI